MSYIHSGGVKNSNWWVQHSFWEVQISTFSCQTSYFLFYSYWILLKSMGSRTLLQKLMGSAKPIEPMPTPPLSFCYRFWNGIGSTPFEVCYRDYTNLDKVSPHIEEQLSFGWMVNFSSKELQGKVDQGYCCFMFWIGKYVPPK